MEWENSIKATDIAIGLATLIAPILAVQAQRFVDRLRAKSDKRDRIFEILMATRAMPMSPQHVEALNMIPIAFYQSEPMFGFVGKQRRTKLTAINKSWRKLLHHFGVDQSGYSQDQSVQWNKDRQKLEIELLRLMGEYLGYEFPDLDIETQVYFPVAHGNALGDNDTIREGLANVFRGKTALPVLVFPGNLPQATQVVTPAPATPPGPSVTP